jgi:hypothetical protein
LQLREQTHDVAPWLRATGVEPAPTADRVAAVVAWCGIEGCQLGEPRPRATLGGTRGDCLGPDHLA